MLPLRFFSVLLGAGLVCLAYLIGRRMFPAWPALAVAVAAFVAFLPQHLATVAQVGNDVLAELLVAAVLLLLLGWLGGMQRGAPKRPGVQTNGRKRQGARAIRPVGHAVRAGVDHEDDRLHGRVVGRRGPDLGMVARAGHLAGVLASELGWFWAGRADQFPLVSARYPDLWLARLSGPGAA